MPVLDLRRTQFSGFLLQLYSPTDDSSLATETRLAPFPFVVIRGFCMYLKKRLLNWFSDVLSLVKIVVAIVSPLSVVFSRCMQHEHVCRIVACCTGSEPMVKIMELLSHSRSGGLFEPNVWLIFFAAVSFAEAYLFTGARNSADYKRSL